MNLKSLFASSIASFALLNANPALADDQTQSEGPAIWKVADADTTIYLFGTIHALPPEIEWFDDDIANALNASDTLVTEISMAPGNEEAMQQYALQAGTLPSGTTLRSLLTAEQTATYEDALSKVSLPEAAFDQFKPWMAGLSLTMLPLIQQGYSADSGVEKVLEANSDPEKALDALETAEFQIGIFDNLPQEKQIAFLMEASAGVDEAKATLDAMVAEWLEGDANALAELMNEGLTDAEVANALLYNRNATWAQWIDSRLDTTPGTVFVAVGAGHLAGEQSVQDYLAERGIMVMRVQ